MPYNPEHWTWPHQEKEKKEKEILASGGSATELYLPLFINLYLFLSSACVSLCPLDMVVCPTLSASILICWVHLLQHLATAPTPTPTPHTGAQTHIHAHTQKKNPDLFLLPYYRPICFPPLSITAALCSSFNSTFNLFPFFSIHSPLSVFCLQPSLSPAPYCCLYFNLCLDLLPLVTVLLVCFCYQLCLPSSLTTGIISMLVCSIIDVA